MDPEAVARKEKYVGEEYLSSLMDLQCNSKPFINMLTMLAEDNIDYAPIIVNVVEQHIAKVPTDLKLPILYLIDSIVKNVQGAYMALFGQCIVNIFCGVFEKASEKVRERMYALRQTWNEVFPASKLYSLDVHVKQMDKNWPITAVKQQPAALKQKPAIHVNPNFLKPVPNELEELLQAKTRELLELKKRKLELELEATKKRIEEQQNQPAGMSSIDPQLEQDILPGTSTQITQILSTPDQAQMPPAVVMSSVPNASIHNQNYVRPRVPIQKGSMPPLVQQAHTGITVNSQHNMNKVKIHPVNPALLNSTRHRDPRLMRQQLQLQQNQRQELSLNQPNMHANHVDNINVETTQTSSNITNATITATDETKRERHGSSKSSSKSSRFNSSTESNTKSPARHDSQISSSHRSNKSSSSNSSSSNRNKDRDRERKRGSESKNYSKSSDKRYQKTGSSSSTSTSPSSLSTKHGNALKSDNDNSDTTSSRRSPSGSPMKYKESNKRMPSGKSSTSSPSRNNGPSRRRSNSCDDIVSSTRDIDLRVVSTTESTGNDAPTTTAAVVTQEPNKKTAVKGLEQNIEKILEPMVMESMATISPAKQDVDLRQIITETIMQTIPRPTKNTQTSSLSVPIPILSLQNIVPVDNVQNATTLDRKSGNLGIEEFVPKTPVLDASSSSIISPKTPKVSFKIQIQKPFNKLAKSTENLSTAITTVKIPNSTTSSSTSPSLSKVHTNDVGESNAKKQVNKVDSSHDDKMDIDEEDEHHLDSRSCTVADGKKRISESGVSDEPTAKKIKSSKMDALFGSEDVDLRTLSIMAKPVSSETLTPPPLNISSSDDDQQPQVTIKNRDQKALKGSTQNSSQKLPSNFEDVRARFAKVTRLNKLDKNHHEKSRKKSMDLNANDDETTQEAEDEKIRIILTQAQEMLESNSLNQGQYKQLVQTVMSINEKNKLKEAKRRELLQQQNFPPSKGATKDTIASPKDDDNSGASTEFIAARDAVLRKRIPKISKTAKVSATNVPECGQQPSVVGGETDVDARDSTVSSLNKLKPKEKRVRHSKWNDRNESQTNSNSNTQQRGWMAGSSGQRPNSGMRGANIPPPPQAPQPPMILGQNLIRPMHGGGGSWSQPGNNGGGGSSSRGMGFGGNQMPLMRSSVPPPPQPPMTIPAVLPALTPNALPKPCNSIDNPQAELVRTITIDGQSKDIRIYDDVAIVFMDIDEPREIGFQPGQRAIIIDNMEPVTLRFNDEYMPLLIAGEQHRVRFGFPSRELYIDEHWYEIYFGGPPVSIPINNRIHVLKAEGPPPQVNIGPLRHDLVVGKIHMIVEAVNLFPLFLDARIQIFRLDNREHTVQFADNLLTVLLDGQPVQVEYGGLPKSYNLSGKRYFIRFTTLPKGVIAGQVDIKEMIYVKTEPTKKIDLPSATSFVADNNEKPERSMDIVQHDDIKTDQNIVPTADVDKMDVTPSLTQSLPPTTAASTALGKINIDELFQKLVSSGILNSNTTTVPPNTSIAEQDKQDSQQPEVPTPEAKFDEMQGKKEEEQLPPIIPIDLRKSESIKTRQAAIISMLYSGMQCSSCGVRFPPEQTIKYSQHLDWHFRQNRRERDSTRKAHSRKWYYDLNDWLQYEEIEDFEEREKNFFETQQNELETTDEASNQRSTNSPLPSCPAGPDDVDRVCDMCQEKFEQFYYEELEEWHLRAALRVEDKIYHPLCYEDIKASQNPPLLTDKDTISKTIDDVDVIMQEDDNAVDVVIKIEEDDKGSDEEPTNSGVGIADEDDDVIVVPNEEPSVTEIVDDDEEYVPAYVSREKIRTSTKNIDDVEESDVEIQEPNIPFTDLDTYVEKEFPILDENSQASFMNVKIKEEPKEDEDDDDGFEDVGTVVYGPHDEISIQSSEETQTQTIVSSADSPLTVGCENSLSANTFNQAQSGEMTSVPHSSGEIDETAMISEESNHISIDGNLEPADGHNLSSVGPAPAIPLGSLVNRIKINITKNTSANTTQPSTSSTVATATSSASATYLPSSTIPATVVTVDAVAAKNNLNSSSNNNSNTKSCNINTLTNVVSTIPVLCAGSTMPTCNLANNGNISNITVIGSYGNYHKPTQHHHLHQQSLTSSLASKTANTVVGTSTSTTAPQAASRQRTPSPPVVAATVPVEDTITFEVKPSLQKATLKKMKKVESGVETSGLCSIM